MKTLTVLRSMFCLFTCVKPVTKSNFFFLFWVGNCLRTVQDKNLSHSKYNMLTNSV